MKIGAGGLQAQIIEDAVKFREVDPVRNKPSHDDIMVASQIAGQDKKKNEQVTKRPVDKTLKNSEAYNQKINRREEEKEQNHREKHKQQHHQKPKKIDLYI